MVSHAGLAMVVPLPDRSHAALADDRNMRPPPSKNGPIWTVSVALSDPTPGQLLALESRTPVNHTTVLPDMVAVLGTPCVAVTHGVTSV